MSNDLRMFKSSVVNPFSLKKTIYLFLAVLGLHCCARALSSCCEQGLLFVVVQGLLTAAASLVGEHSL